MASTHAPAAANRFSVALSLAVSTMQFETRGSSTIITLFVSPFYDFLQEAIQRTVIELYNNYVCFVSFPLGYTYVKLVYESAT